MALNDLIPAELLSAVATDYLADSTLREAPLLGMLAANGIMQPQRPIEWGAKVGSAVVTGRAIAAPLSDDTNGILKGAALTIPDYYVKHQFSVIKRDLANAVATGKISAVRNPITTAVADAVDQINRKINGLLYTANGTVDSTHFGIVGLGVAAQQTGNYAGLSRTTFPRWRSILSQGTTPGTPEALTIDKLNTVLRARRAAGAADRPTAANDLVIVCSDEIEKDVLRKLYASAVDEQALYEQTSKDIAPYINYFVRGIPVVSDVDAPPNTMQILNLSKIGLYAFDDRAVNEDNPRISYIPMRVEGYEDSTIYIRIADVSDEHPDVYKMELSVSLQLAVWDLKDGITRLEDVKNTIP